MWHLYIASEVQQTKSWFQFYKRKGHRRFAYKQCLPVSTPASLCDANFASLMYQIRQIFKQILLKFNKQHFIQMDKLHATNSFPTELLKGIQKLQRSKFIYSADNSTTVPNPGRKKKYLSSKQATRYYCHKNWEQKSKQTHRHLIMLSRQPSHVSRVDMVRLQMCSEARIRTRQDQ